MSPEIAIRQAVPRDAEAIHVLLRPFVMQRLLLSRTATEIIELTQHGFVAQRTAAGGKPELVGFAAVEILWAQVGGVAMLGGPQRRAGQWGWPSAGRTVH